MSSHSLISESISILREASLIPGSKALLFSGGKDSITLLHLSRMAFWPAPIPFFLLHVDTGHNFQEIDEFIQKVSSEFHISLVREKVQDLITDREVDEPTGYYRSRNQLQSLAVQKALRRLSIKALVGGARRDEERARAKQKIFSLRDADGKQGPHNESSPEFWNLYNSELPSDKTLRVFPLCHWTELDVWNFVANYNIEVPPLYYSHQRECVIKKDGSLLTHHPLVCPDPSDPITSLKVRFRTIGDMTCSLGCKSLAKNALEVIEEIKKATISERGVRADDQFSATSMEDRRRMGYF